MEWDYLSLASGVVHHLREVMLLAGTALLLWKRRRV